MKLSRPTIGLFVLIAIVSASGCGYINSIRAKSQLNEAVSSYKDKKYDDAEKYARKAMELDPANKNAPLILAVILQTLYRRGDEDPANRAKAEEALKLYQEVVKNEPNNDQAFTAVTVLLGYLGRTDEQVQWVEARANNDAVSRERRSDAIAFLTNKDWNCSLAVTDSKESKVLVQKGDTVVIQYKKPEDVKKYEEAMACMTRGLERAEKAINLNPESDTAWALKSNLLREAAKIAKMDENEDKAKEYEKQATDAAKQSTELKLKKNQQQAQPSPPPAG